LQTLYDVIEYQDNLLMSYSSFDMRFATVCILLYTTNFSRSLEFCHALSIYFLLLFKCNWTQHVISEEILRLFFLCGYSQLQLYSVTKMNKTIAGVHLYYVTKSNWYSFSYYLSYLR